MVREAAQTVLELARREEDAASDAAESSVGADLPTIEDSHPPADLATILAEWRSVERLLDMADPGSPESERLMAEFEAVRDRYSQAMEARRRQP